MIDPKYLEELEKIAASSPEKCARKLKAFIARERKRAELYLDRVGYTLDVNPPKKGTRWHYFYLTKWGEGRSRTRITLGKMKADTYELHQEELEVSRSEKRFEEVMPYLTPIERRKKMRLQEEMEELVAGLEELIPKK